MLSHYSSWFYLFVAGFAVWILRFGSQLSTAALFSLYGIVLFGFVLIGYRQKVQNSQPTRSPSPTYLVIASLALVILLLDVLSPTPQKPEVVFQIGIFAVACLLVWNRKNWD